MGKFFIRMGSGFGGLFALIGVSFYLWADRSTEIYPVFFVAAAIFAIPCWIIGWAAGGFDD